MCIIHPSLYYHTNKLNKWDKRVINLHQNPFILFILREYDNRKKEKKKLLVRSEKKHKTARHLVSAHKQSE